MVRFVGFPAVVSLILAGLLISPAPGADRGDLTGDGFVDINDLTVLSENWLDESLLMSSGVLDFCRRQLIATSNTQDSNTYPSETDCDYKLWQRTFSPDASQGWTLGFFPGALWYMHELTGSQGSLSLALMWTLPLRGQQYNTATSDQGLILMGSFGHAYRLTGVDEFRQVVVQGAESSASRYSPVVGCLRSWSWGDWESPTKFTVVVDTMMCIEALFWASRNGGGSDLYDKAVSHAYKTMQNHVRVDGSTYHVVVYYPDTGEVNYKTTHQGYSTESCWSRGQAWALYGFTMCYRETGDQNFLETAKKVADYFVDNLPPDSVPYSDFDAPGIPNVEKDSSAAAIAASGLLELCTLVSEPTYQEKYYNAAKNILISLSTKYSNGGYLTQDGNGDAGGCSILMRACKFYSYPEQGLIYADYYFIEALMRYKGLTNF